MSNWCVVCVLCKKEITNHSFKDSLSEHEFCLSGLCQACQDQAFTAPTFTEPDEQNENDSDLDHDRMYQRECEYEQEREQD